MADLALLENLKLISRKIWVIGKSRNFHTVHHESNFFGKQPFWQFWSWTPCKPNLLSKNYTIVSRKECLFCIAITNTTKSFSSNESYFSLGGEMLQLRKSTIKHKCYVTILSPRIIAVEIFLEKFYTWFVRQFFNMTVFMIYDKKVR